MSDSDEVCLAMGRVKKQMFEYNKKDIEEYYDGKTYFEIDEAYASLYKNALLKRHYVRKAY
jgi:hypothetical protein